MFIKSSLLQCILFLVCLGLILARTNTAAAEKQEALATQPVPSVIDSDLSEFASMQAVQHANSLIRSGKTQEAIAELTQIIESDSGTVDTHYAALAVRAKAFRETGRIDKALADCNQALGDPHLSLKPDVYLLRAHVYRKTNKLSSAADDLERVIELPQTQEKMRANSREELKELRESASQASSKPAAR